VAATATFLDQNHHEHLTCSLEHGFGRAGQRGTTRDGNVVEDVEVFGNFAN
jgi:hypothetical protein